MKRNPKNDRLPKQKIIREKYKELLIRNEIEANNIVSWVLFVTGIVYLIVGVLNIFGIIATKSTPLYMTLFASCLVAATVATVFRRLKDKSAKWIKYVSFFLICVSVFVINIAAGYKLWMLYAVPIFLSVRYYNRRFTCVTAVYVAVFALASTFTNAYLAEYTRLVDLNLISFSEPGTLEYWSWLHNAVINHGFDTAKVVKNGLRLSVIPNLIVIFLLTLTSLTLVDHAVKMILKEHEEHEKKMQLLTASTVDSLTGLFNRRAYNEDCAAITPEALKNTVLVMFDVNGLKAANDNIGHSAGDELIKGAGECIGQVFTPYGKAYRWGGDEFAAIIYTDGTTLEKIKNEFTECVAGWKGELVKSLSVSVGYAAAWEGENLLSISEMEPIADKRMYENKEAHYAANPNETRRV